MKQRFDVTGMSCTACSSHVERAVSALAGVSSVTVDLMQNRMLVEYDDSKLSEAEVCQAVAAAGYGARPRAPRLCRPAPCGGLPAERTRLCICVGLLLVLLYISMGHMMGLPLPSFLSGHHNALWFGLVQLVLTLAIAVLQFRYFRRGFASLFRGAPTMDTLVAVGSSAAILYGVYAIIRIAQGLATGDMELVAQYHMDLYFESAGTILTLVSVGKYWEARSKSHTADALQKADGPGPRHRPPAAGWQGSRSPAGGSPAGAICSSSARVRPFRLMAPSPKDKPLSMNLPSPVKACRSTNPSAIPSPAPPCAAAVISPCRPPMGGRNHPLPDHSSGGGCRRYQSPHPAHRR